MLCRFLTAVSVDSERALSRLADSLYPRYTMENGWLVPMMVRRRIAAMPCVFCSTLRVITGPFGVSPSRLSRFLSRLSLSFLLPHRALATAELADATTRPRPSGLSKLDGAAAFPFSTFVIPSGFWTGGRPRRLEPGTPFVTCHAAPDRPFFVPFSRRRVIAVHCYAMSAAPELDAWNNLPLITFVNIQSDGDGTARRQKSERERDGEASRSRCVREFAHLFKLLG